MVVEWTPMNPFSHFFTEIKNKSGFVNPTLFTDQNLFEPFTKKENEYDNNI